MSILVREDGVCFVLNAYRERFAFAKRSLLIHRIRLLAEQHGEYIQIAAIPGENSLEITFSQQPGYLLGDIIWHHFGKPYNLIYCQRLIKDSTQVLLIIIRDGSIFLDTQIPQELITNELIPLLTCSNPFHIITENDLPISQEPRAGYFHLPPNLVTNFEILSNSVIPYLPLIPEYEVIPLSQALTSKILGEKRSWTYALPLIALTLLLLAWWFYPTKPEVITPAIPIVTESKNPYDEFYQALNSVNPRQLLTELIIIINNFSVLPGWSITSIIYDYTQNQFQIQLSRNGGDARWIENWSKKNNLQINFTNSGAQLLVTPKSINRSRPDKIYPIDQLISFLDDHLNQLVTDDGFTVSDSENHGEAQEVKINLNINGLSASLLGLLGQTLENLPIRIDKIELNQGNENLLTGTIQLSVWGK